jgi:hypothetical protein
MKVEMIESVKSSRACIGECRRQEQCVTIRDISFLLSIREEVELRRFEGTFRLLSPENSGKVSMKRHVSHPTDRIPHVSNRHSLLFNK